MRQYPKIHIERVIRLSEIRNAFVHYKWKERDLDEKDDEKERAAQNLKGIEATIRYLLTFEDKHLLKGSRKVLKQIASERAELK